MNEKTKFVARTGVLIALAAVFQIVFSLIPLSPILKTALLGAMVNLVLYVAVVSVGPISAVAISFITPLVAFLTGKLLPAVLIPFVGLGNAVMVLSYWLVRRNGREALDYFGLGLSAVLKFGIMQFMVSVIVPHLPGIKPPMIKSLSLTWSYPQFIAAAAGAVLSVFVVKALSNTGILVSRKAAPKNQTVEK